MKKLELLIATIALLASATVGAQTPQDSAALAGATWTHWELPHKASAMQTSVRLFGSAQCITVIRYKATHLRTQIVQAPTMSMTSDLAQQNGAVAAINGSYFNVKALVPATFVRVNGRTLATTEAQELFRVNGVLAIKRHKLEVISCDTTHYAQLARKYKHLLAAGPVLIDDGKIRSYESRKGFFGRHPRSVIGRTKSHEIIMIVVDGRFPNRAEGMSIDELTRLAQLLGMTEAINLDGGGSATLWGMGQGVLNHPYDNKKFDHAGERSVTNCIVARP